MTRRARRGLRLACAGLCWLFAGVTAAADDPRILEPGRRLGVQSLGDGRYRAEFLSPLYRIDRLYRSMKGPWRRQAVQLLDEVSSAGVWVTSYYVQVVGPDGHTPLPDEFMCHSNLNFSAQSLRPERAGSSRIPMARLLTISQGQMAVRFPEGFGLPMDARQSLELVTQVLNANREGPPFDVRYKIQIEFIRPEEAHTRLRPLFAAAAVGLALVDGAGGGYFNIAQPDPDQHGPGCLPGEAASRSSLYTDAQGRTFTGHWVVKPGRQVNRTLVTQALRLPYDTTVHFAVAHLHPFAESLELRDLTTGQTVLSARATNFSDHIGLSSVETVSSPDGILLFKDHEYEVVSVYNNTTDVDQDSMAVFYLYLLDRELEDVWRTARSSAAPPSAAAE